MRSEYLVWLYIKNVFGRAKGVFVRIDGRLIGFMALVPVRVLHGQSDILAHYVVNVLVHPDHQGKNLFSRMITVAVDFSKQGRFALIGHPNDQALKFWQRKRMAFQDELHPRLILPYYNSNFRKTYRIDSESELDECFGRGSDFGASGDGLSVDVSPEYIKWRFASHPSNRYIIVAGRLRDGGMVIQVVRRLSFGKHMLIDVFHSGRTQQISAAGLPLVTASFRPSSEAVSVAHGEFAIPLRKRIPYFVSMFDLLPAGSNVAMPGLSASDF